MLVTVAATVCFGVYSPLYSNGHMFVFFIALCNFYVWALIYLNWPIFEHLEGVGYGATNAHGVARQYGYSPNERDPGAREIEM